MLTESDNILKKEMGRFTFHAELSSISLMIAIVNDDTGLMNQMQLDKLEQATLIRYLGGDKNIREALKKYESIFSDSLDRMEELKRIIKYQNEIIRVHYTTLKKKLNTLIVNSEEFKEASKTLAEMNLAIKKVESIYS